MNHTKNTPPADNTNDLKSSESHLSDDEVQALALFQQLTPQNRQTILVVLRAIVGVEVQP
ncbi:hypothetical protein [Thiothrix nivea]|uniref:Transcriptional regulator n=1 Tax=Thiothrix nivea (strain ATCC 35100 / DSM 5205 / JP2) TaxID=870187 RepID=A0A656HCV2_THINJ|nr:hypothetical protein [Thiothrix nivea]EIJ34708.1 hypothetical protein Thini_2141 [Thiothrix nivea DSM 5205]